MRVQAAARVYMLTRQPFKDTALGLEVWFYLERPKSLPKSVQFPAKKPDLDKLVRTIGDCMQGSVYDEDSRLVSHYTHKRFVRPGGTPCAVIAVYPITDENAPKGPRCPR
jgi:Holliday junction resolvase RusA-like endonuclease